MSDEIKQWCDRHWQPYRDMRGNGLLASVLLMQALIDHRPAMDEAGLIQAMDRVSTEAALNLVMQRHQPICCWLGDELMDRIFAEART